MTPRRKGREGRKLGEAVAERAEGGRRSVTSSASPAESFVFVSKEKSV